MARIDTFIQTIYAYEADGLVLQPGEKVLLVSGSDRVAVSSGPAALHQVEELLREILPEGMQMPAEDSGGCEFVYAAPSGRVSVRAHRSRDSVLVKVVPLPAGASPRDATGVEPSAAAAPRMNEAAPPPSAAGAAQAAPAAARPRIEALFEEMVRWKCSDLHLTAGNRVLYRKDGEIVALGDSSPLTAEQVRDLLWPIVPGPNRAEFEVRRDTDFSHEILGLARFRCNLFMDRMGMGAACRVIPNHIPTVKELIDRIMAEAEKLVRIRLERMLAA